MTEIELPDGRIIELTGNESPFELQALKNKLRTQYSGYEPQETTQPEPVQAGQAAPAGLGADLRQRMQTIGSLQRQREAGEISKAEEGFRSAGQLAGGMGDVVGSALGAALRGADYLTGGRLGDAAGSAVSAVGSVPLPFTEKDLGQVAIEGVQAAGETYGRFKEERPRTAGMIEAAGNLATVIPSFAAYADDIAKGAVKTAGALKKPSVLPSDVVRKQASELYKQADEIGGALKPDFSRKFANKISRTGEKDNFITAIKRKAGQEDAYANVLDVLADYADEPLSFDRAKALDETLGSLAYSNVDNFGKLDDVGRQYLDMQTTLREMIENASPADFIGNDEAFKVAKEARKYWAAQNKLRDIERIVQNAERFDTPAKAIQTGFRTLLRNGKRIKGYSPKEVKAMEKAARTGVVTDALRLAGSGLGPIISGSVGGATMGAGGMLAAVPAFALQSTAKGMATGRQMGRARNVSRTISQGLTQAPQSSVMREAAGAAIPMGAALSPAAVADLTKEQIQYIMSLPPEQARQILGGN